MCLFQLILADRSLMPGDVIRRFGEDSKKQSGFVQDLIGKCHVHIRGTNKFLYNVNSKDLSSMKVEEIARKVSSTQDEYTIHVFPSCTIM